MKRTAVLMIFLLALASTLPAEQATLQLHEDLTGRISIRDNLDILVVELTKTQGAALSLNLDPGLYRILLERGNNFYRAEITLSEGSTTTLSMADFSLIAAAPETMPQVDEPERIGWRNPFGNSLYTFFFNIVDEDFRFPLIGLFNLAIGNFNSVQAGFVNWNTRDLTGVQAGYINTIGGNLSGVQAGFINTVAGDSGGFQAGFINTTRGLDGFQGGFANTAIHGGRGVQAGFLNISTRQLSGFQVGFVNYADSIEDGIPVGFVSIVRQGGYRAFEYSFSEFYPFTLGFKIGVERFYTSIYAAFNPIDENSHYSFASGWGFGTIIPISPSFFFNPDYVRLNASTHVYYWYDEEEEEEHYIFPFARSHSLILYFGYNFNSYLSIVAGPSVTWTNFAVKAPIEPLFSLLSHEMNAGSSIVIGARAGLRFRF